jgi:hypothetical protein
MESATGYATTAPVRGAWSTKRRLRSNSKSTANPLLPETRWTTEFRIQVRGITVISQRPLLLESEEAARTLELANALEIIEYIEKMA